MLTLLVFCMMLGAKIIVTRRKAHYHQQDLNLLAFNYALLMLLLTGSNWIFYSLPLYHLVARPVLWNHP